MSDGPVEPLEIPAAYIERSKVAEALMAQIFALRPDSSERGQAFVLTMATTFLTRAILASAGPAGETGDVIKVAFEQITLAVENAQLQYQRDLLTAKAGPRRVQ